MDASRTAVAPLSLAPADDCRPLLAGFRTVIALLVGASLLLAVGPTAAGNAPVGRHTGYIQSVRPSDHTLLIDEVGGGEDGHLRVKIRNAVVVRVWRDPANPWVRRERETTIYQWPVGTLVIVIGRATAPGAVEASRIEIPTVSWE